MSTEEFEQDQKEWNDVCNENVNLTILFELFFKELQIKQLQSKMIKMRAEFDEKLAELRDYCNWRFKWEF